MKRFTDSPRPYQKPHSCAFWLTTKLRLPRLIGFLAPLGDVFNDTGRAANDMYRRVCLELSLFRQRRVRSDGGVSQLAGLQPVGHRPLAPFLEIQPSKS